MKTGFSFLIAALVATLALTLFSPSVQARPAALSGNGQAQVGGNLQSSKAEYAACTAACFDDYIENTDACEKACEYCAEKWLWVICIQTKTRMGCLDSCDEKAEDVHADCKAACTEARDKPQA